MKVRPSYLNSVANPQIPDPGSDFFQKGTGYWIRIRNTGSKPLNLVSSGTIVTTHRIWSSAAPVSWLWCGSRSRCDIYADPDPAFQFVVVPDLREKLMGMLIRNSALDDHDVFWVETKYRIERNIVNYCFCFREIYAHFYGQNHKVTKTISCADCGQRFVSRQSGGIRYHRYH